MIDVLPIHTGFSPSRVLPVVIDVGTDNEELREDPLYAGLRQPRLKGKEYYDIVDEVCVRVCACVCACHVCVCVCVRVSCVCVCARVMQNPQKCACLIFSRDKSSEFVCGQRAF